MARIHPSAIVEPGAQIDTDVEIGPFCVVGADVKIAAGSQLGPHVVMSGVTTIGRNNRFFAGCAVGGEPQDKKFARERTELVIGDGNTVREFCTLNVGTGGGGGVTRIGSDNWIMAYVHIAHDCQVGDHTIMANSVQLAGHVTVGDWAILGGITGVHQFVRIGAHAMTGAGTTLLQDLPPYVICNGNPASAHGLNAEGLRRRGFTTEAIGALKRAYRNLYRAGMTLEQSRAALAGQIAGHRADPTLPGERSAAEALQALADFLAITGRGIVR